MTALPAALLAGVAVLACLPAGAQAGYSSELIPISEPAPSGNTVVSDVAIAPNGDALVAWSEGDATNVVLKARRVLADGSLGEILTISDGTQRAFEGTLAIMPNGRAVIVWAEAVTVGSPNSLRARWIEPGDSLGPQFTVRNGGVNSNSADLAVTATTSNDAIAAWHNLNSTPFRIVEARRVKADNSTGGLIPITSAAGSTGVVAAPNSSGGALLAWRQSSTVQAQSIAANDAPGTVQAAAPSASATPALAAGGSDRFQLLYRKGNGPSSLEYRPLGADGTGGPEQNLDPPGTNLLSNYDVATNTSNRSLATWARPAGTNLFAIGARFIAADGTPDAATQTTSVTTSNGSSVDGGIGGSGRAAIAWSQVTPEGIGSIWGRTLSSAEDPSTPVQISSTTGSASPATVEMAANDVGVSAWRETIDPAATEPQARVLVRQVLPPPTCPDATGTVVQGRPVRIALNCTGLQLVAPAVVAQPDHGTVDDPDAATQSLTYTPDPGFDGTDTFTFTGVNRGGPGAPQTATVTVGKDTVKPRIKKFKITTKRVRFSGARRAKGKKPAFKLRYSEPATAKIVIERRNDCPRAEKRCKKFKRVGKLRARPAKPSAKVVLKRRLGGRPLKPSSYRATAVATDPAGNRSKPKRLKFKVR